MKRVLKKVPKDMNRLILMRGLPGSGKSTLAKQLLSEHMKTSGSNGVILSTDHQFMVNDKCVFDYTKLGWAHNRNQILAEKAMSDNISLVIIDNTNLSNSERMPYIRMAENYGYSYEIVDSNTEWANNPEECFKKCTHGVPLASLKKMYEKLKQDRK